MTINWEKDDKNNSINFYIKYKDARIGIYFENELYESSCTFSSDTEIEAANLPTEFIDALRKHLEARK